MWISPYYVAMAEGYFFLKNYPDAIEWLDRAISQPNAFFTPYVLKASALAYIGSIEEAKLVHQEVSKKFPDSVDHWKYHFNKFYGGLSGQIFDGLQKAGIS